MTDLNQNGKLVIKTYEGLRLKAYPDPGTGGEPWTIGYGHTSSAGAPDVYEGLVITLSDANQIFDKDSAAFASEVENCVSVELNPNQLGALTSFAYNLGIPKFKRSSVLRAVEQGKGDEVARRLMTYNRAAGRVLPGLVKRRAAEAHLYNMLDTQMSTGVQFASFDPAPLLSVHLASCTQAELDEMCGAEVDEPLGKTGMQSTTNISAVLSGAGAAGMAGIETIKSYVDDLGITGTTMVMIIIAAGVCCAAYYIISERNKKAADYGV